MRIISGILRGRKLHPPAKTNLRPTTDRAKENLFNSLAFKLDWTESNVLDLCSGSGNIAFEFYSRGCPLVYSVDKNPICITYQKRLAAEWNVEGMHFIKADAIQYIQSATQRFDVIFADPPYAMKNMEDLIHQILHADILKPDAMVIIEHDTTHDFSAHENFVRQLKYGQTIFSIFKK